MLNNHGHSPRITPTCSGWLIYKLSAGARKLRNPGREFERCVCDAVQTFHLVRYYARCFGNARRASASSTDRTSPAISAHDSQTLAFVAGA